MTERRLPGGLVSADENDIIQRGPGGLWHTRGSGEIILPGRFLLRTIYETGTALTHVLNSKTTKFLVRGQGPGGGGGAVDGQGAGTAGCGGSGSCGHYFEHIFTVAPGILSFTYSIGVGGVAGTMGVNSGNGGNGTGATQVTYNGVTVGGNFGTGGNGEVASAGFPRFKVPELAEPGVVGVPQIVSGNRVGAFGLVLSATHIISGAGGHSQLGRGGQSAATTTGAAVAGDPGVYGGGGAGAVAGEGTSSNVDGGAGGNGILIVDEYS